MSTIKRSRRATVIKVGGSSVTVSNTLEMQADQLARELAPDLAQLMTSEMGLLYDSGLRRWPEPGEKHPRSTGRSARAMKFQAATVLSRGVIVTSVSNAARNPRDGFAYPYAIRTKVSKGKLIWNEYFEKPFKKRTKAVITEMVDAFLKLSEVHDG